MATTSTASPASITEWDVLSPDVVLDLSTEHGQHDCFLLAYTARNGSLSEVAVVVENALYKGSKSCVEKPTAKKNLTEQAHLSKVTHALVAAAAAAEAATTSQAAARSVSTNAACSPNRDSGAGSSLQLTVSKGDAVLTVKEAVKGGTSFVVLATVRLPLVDEASGGLLLGVVRAAFRRGQEAVRLRRDLERADQERARFKGLLDTAISDKRKVLYSVLDRVALVVNSKKAMIETLQEQGSNEDSGDESDGASREDDGEPVGASDAEAGGEIDDTDGVTASPAGKRKGKAKKLAVVDAKCGGESSTGRGGGRGRDTANLAPGLDSAAGMGEGGGALAVPMGTQEISGDALFLHMAEGGQTTSRSRPRSIVKEEEEEERNNANLGGKTTPSSSVGSKRRRRPNVFGSDSISEASDVAAPPSSCSPAPNSAAGSGRGGGVGGAGTLSDEAHRLLGGHSSGSDEEDGRRSTRVRAKRRRRKVPPPVSPPPTSAAAAAASAAATASSQGRGGASSGAEARGSADATTTGVSGATRKGSQTKMNPFSWMDDSDSDIDDLQ